MKLEEEIRIAAICQIHTLQLRLVMQKLPASLMENIANILWLRLIKGSFSNFENHLSTVLIVVAITRFGRIQRCAAALKVDWSPIVTNPSKKRLLGMNFETVLEGFKFRCEAHIHARRSLSHSEGASQENPCCSRLAKSFGASGREMIRKPHMEHG